MIQDFNPSLTRLKPLYPGQWGIQGSDNKLGLRTDTRSTIFYVDSGHALTNDNNDGTDPDAPLTTITEALTRCTSNANDFILVRQITNALETFPITITVNRVHLISVFYDLGKGPEIRPVADTAGILLSADNVEIAGFEINGGATSGAIQTQTAAPTWGADIHHNQFRNCVDTGIMAIDPGSGPPSFGLIHDNVFHDCLQHAMDLPHCAEMHIYRNSIYNAAAQSGIAATDMGILTTGGDYNQVFDNNFSCLLPVAAPGDYNDLNTAAGTDAWIGNHCMNGLAVTNPT